MHVFTSIYIIYIYIYIKVTSTHARIRLRRCIQIATPSVPYFRALRPRNRRGQTGRYIFIYIDVYNVVRAIWSGFDVDISALNKSG
jgi:hypothetical protein